MAHSTDRWNLCLDPEEYNYSSNGNSIGRFRPRVDSKISRSMTFLLEITLIGIIKSSSRGPESRRSPHWRTVRQKIPECIKNVVKTLIPPQHWKPRRDFFPIGFTKYSSCFRLQISRRKILPGSTPCLTWDTCEKNQTAFRWTWQQKCYHISALFLSLSCSVQ